jgi:plastocyanin
MFQVGIKVDGTLRVTFPVSMLEPGEILRMVNAELSSASPGQHLVELIVDVDNRIAESDETDNTFTIMPVWVTPTPVPTKSKSTQPNTSVSTVMSPIANFTLKNHSVSVGDTIRWENQDAAPHTSTSGVSPVKDGVWDSGILNTGQKFEFTFQNPGVFAYWCAVHPSMTATITVTQ